MTENEKNSIEEITADCAEIKAGATYIKLLIGKIAKAEGKASSDPPYKEIIEECENTEKKCERIKELTRELRGTVEINNKTAEKTAALPTENDELPDGRYTFNKAVIDKVGERSFILLKGSLIPEAYSDSLSSTAKNIREDMKKNENVLYKVTAKGGRNYWKFLENYTMNNSPSTVCSVICGYSTNLRVNRQKFVPFGN